MSHTKPATSLAITILLLIISITCLVVDHFRPRGDIYFVRLEREEEAQTDSFYINSATHKELKKFGFNYRDIYSIKSYLEAGGYFRSWEKLSATYNLDTASIGDRKHLISYAPPREREWKNYGPRKYEKKRSARVSFYYTDSATLAGYGISGAVWDSLKYFRENYVLRGSTTVDSLRAVDADGLRAFLAPYMTAGQRFAAAAEERERITVEVNSASVEDLVKLRYVKQKTAKAIVDYREELGGFVSLEQLREVWILREDTARANEVIAQMTLESGSPRRMDVNRVKMDEFRQHPYVRKNKALRSALYQYRMKKRAGKIRDIEHFRELFGKTKYNPLLEEYLSF